MVKGRAVEALDGEQLIDAQGRLTGGVGAFGAVTAVQGRAAAAVRGQGAAEGVTLEKGRGRAECVGRWGEGGEGGRRVWAVKWEGGEDKV